MLEKYQKMLEDLKKFSRGYSILFKHYETLKIMKGGLNDVKPIYK